MEGKERKRKGGGSGKEDPPLRGKVMKIVL